MLFQVAPCYEINQVDGVETAARAAAEAETKPEVLTLADIDNSVDEASSIPLDDEGFHASTEALIAS